MIKKAQTRYPVIDLIKNRWSARAFSDQPITKEQILTLIEAASWAPSSMNEQPWRYRFGLKGDPIFQHLQDCLLPGNQAWAKNAAALLLGSVKTHFARNGQPNHYALHDAGMANSFLMLQATEMQIFGHIMAGFDPEKLRATFALGDDETAVCIIALGYLGTPEQLEEPFRTRELTPRTRFQPEDFILDSPSF